MAEPARRLLATVVLVLGAVSPASAQDGTAARDATAATAEMLSRVAPELGWVEGRPEAPVTVVEFSDPSCPYCDDFHSDVRARLHEEFVAGGQVRWITLSYVSGLYRNSLLAVQAAECAGEQGAYEAYMDGVYERQGAWAKAAREEALTVLRNLAVRLDLGIATWNACRNERRVRDRVRRVNALAEEVGVRGTPTWFVDGFPVMGALPLGYARSFIVNRLSGRR
jgi:protein-disulfide isomerase